jgi:hypothetical protein
LLERFNDEVNDHTFFVGWYEYVLAVGALPIEAQVTDFPEAGGGVQGGPEKGLARSDRQISVG